MSKATSYEQFFLASSPPLLMSSRPVTLCCRGIRKIRFTGFWFVNRSLDLNKITLLFETSWIEFKWISCYTTSNTSFVSLSCKFLHVIITAKCECREGKWNSIICFILAAHKLIQQHRFQILNVHVKFCDLFL